METCLRPCYTGVESQKLWNHGALRDLYVWMDFDEEDPTFVSSFFFVILGGGRAWLQALVLVERFYNIFSVASKARRSGGQPLRTCKAAQL